MKKRSEALTAREAQLKQEQENLYQKKHGKREHKVAQDKLAQRENEIKIAQQKVAETFRNAEHSREITEIKMQKVQEVNQQLRLAISAARQRAKRLTIKAKNGA